MTWICNGIVEVQQCYCNGGLKIEVVVEMKAEVTSIGLTDAFEWTLMKMLCKLIHIICYMSW